MPDPVFFTGPSASGCAMNGDFAMHAGSSGRRTLGTAWATSRQRVSLGNRVAPLTAGLSPFFRLWTRFPHPDKNETQYPAG